MSAEFEEQVDFEFFYVNSPDGQRERRFGVRQFVPRDEIREAMLVSLGKDKQ